MNNGFVHDRALLDPLVGLFENLGAVVYREYPVRLGGRVCYGDLWVHHEAKRYLIEAENGPRRIGRDLVKAAVLRADLLAIIVPTWMAARSVRRRVGNLTHSGRPSVAEVWVLPIGVAIRRFRTRTLSLVNGQAPSRAMRSPDS